MRGRFFATNGVAATFFKIAKGILEDAAKKKVMDTLKEQVGGNSKNEANKSFQKYMDQLCKHALDRYKEEILSLVESNEIVNPHPKGLDSSIHDLGSFRKTRDALIESTTQDTELRHMLSELLSAQQIARQFAVVFPPVLDGWKYFHWVAGQELAQQDPTANLGGILNNIRERVPELQRYPAQNADDLFKYILANIGPEGKVQGQLPLGSVPSTLGQIYDEYPGVTTRLRTYLTPLNHPLP